MSEVKDDKLRILIVDDEPEIRGVLFELLSAEYDCVAARSAEEALARLGSEEFHIVVSDIMMRGMSGLEMIPHACAYAPDAVVVMISGAHTIESAIEAMRAGAFDYVMKPFELTHVEAVVRRAAEHYALRAAKRRYENHLTEMVEQRTAELNHALASLEDSYRATLKALTSSLETRDSETHGHSERVVSFSLRLGRELGLGREALRSLEFGALLHDIGKIGVPDAILRKPASLTPDEWGKMRVHPLLGRQILEGIEFLEGAARVVAEHHEKWDGSGYPLGLKGEAIDLNARIFAVADAFDAMTSDRVYRAGRPYEAAAAELDEFAGTQFDPAVVAAFHRVPPEDWVEMRRQSVTRRKAGGERRKSPKVKSLFDARRRRLANCV
ncbi:MAG TPA: HD domain-containing phosphohydrolase [Pyrinomonadaceae bacterium]|nr:HD domain-containing phosphohydrolase [Pyrinomonadaceae bacterium]